MSAQDAPNVAILQQSLGKTDTESGASRAAIMAGSQLKKQEQAEAEARVVELERELQQMRQILAIHAPGIMLGHTEPPLTEWSNDIPEQIKALGKAGLSEDEMIVALNVTREKWREFKDIFPEMAPALAYARDLALADLAKLEREAMTRRLWGSHLAAIKERRKALLEQGDTRGEAALLVRVNKGSTITNRPALCPRCAADTAGSGQAADPKPGSE